PAYVLIVGGPSDVPFRFQAMLGASANVGRLAFDRLEDLEQYVAKVVRIERGGEPIVDREAVVFATDEGPQDPTHFSSLYMAKPLAGSIRELSAMKTIELGGKDATKANLLGTLTRGRPALVFTASHGLGLEDESFEMQRRYNGAICCEGTGALDDAELVAAHD